MSGPVPTSARLWALGYGVATHALFLLGVGSMVLGLYQGLSGGHGPFGGFPALLANLLLVAQFPLLHSGLLTRSGRRWLARLAPRPLGAALSSTTFAAISSLQLLALFALWSPSGVVWWRPRGVPLVATTAAYAASWLFLKKALWDAGLALHSGFLGWGAMVRGRWPRLDGFPTAGLFRACRQPIYLGFALTLWTGPVVTPDRLALAVAFTAYCIVGPRLKERRYVARHGNAYRAYQAEVPYMWPSWPPRLPRAERRSVP